MEASSLHSFFYPKGIAVVGASKNPNKASHQILRSMVVEGFTGNLYPVNPGETELLGLKVYPSLAAVPGECDLVVIAVPAPHVPGVMREAAARGDVKAAIIVSAGFSETGIPERVALERETLEIAKQAGIRVMGPNCVGVINTENNLVTSFHPGLKMVKGNIAVFTQSGAAGGTILMAGHAEPAPMGFAKWGHVGNMSDVTNLELLEYFGEDPTVKVIAGYVESVRDGRELMRLADRITRKKPILLLKVGRTELGSKAALSHTGALAGSDRVYDAALAQCGIIRVQTMTELVDAARAISMLPMPKGNRVCILTEAGGPGIIAMDELGADGSVTLAPLTQETQEKLAKVLPPMAMIAKPNGYVDMTAAAMEKQHAEALRIVLEDPNVDSVILISVPPTFLPAEWVAREVAKVAKTYDKPVVINFMMGESMAAARRHLEENGLPTFETPERAARALINLTKAAARLAPGAAAEAAAAGAVEIDATEVHPAVREAIRQERNLLEHEAVHLLSDAGVKTHPCLFARNREAAMEAADSIGYPVVIKVVSPQILHKSDYGGVRLNLKDREAVGRAYDEMMQGVRAKAPDAEILGAVVTPFVTGGAEVIVGMTRDPQFGPVIMFGMGGIFVEVFKDVSFRVAPFTRQEALAMIDETKASAVLRGARGAAPKDVEALADLLVRVGNIAVANPQIREMDLNPVLVQEHGLAVLDARVIVQGAK